MKALKAEYKDYDETEKSSGEKGQFVLLPKEEDRQTMKLTHDLMVKCVTVNPKLTLGAGFQTHYRRSNQV